jgi:hypothetical protein
MLPKILRERRLNAERPVVPIAEIVPRMPIRGSAAAGHRSRIAESWASEAGG